MLESLLVRIMLVNSFNFFDYRFERFRMFQNADRSFGKVGTNSCGSIRSSTTVRLRATSFLAYCQSIAALAPHTANRRLHRVLYFIAKDAAPGVALPNKQRNHRTCQHTGPVWCTPIVSAADTYSRVAQYVGCEQCWCWLFGSTKIQISVHTHHHRT